MESASPKAPPADALEELKPSIELDEVSSPISVTAEQQIDKIAENIQEIQKALCENTEQMLADGTLPFLDVELKDLRNHYKDLRQGINDLTKYRIEDYKKLNKLELLSLSMEEEELKAVLKSKMLKDLSDWKKQIEDKMKNDQYKYPPCYLTKVKDFESIHSSKFISNVPLYTTLHPSTFVYELSQDDANNDFEEIQKEAKKHQYNNSNDKDIVIFDNNTLNVDNVMFSVGNEINVIDPNNKAKGVIKNISKFKVVVEIGEKLVPIFLNQIRKGLIKIEKL